ncbi:hypothetical protein AB0K37_39235, partial [Actinomadura sp. NPDC049753]
SRGRAPRRPAPRAPRRPRRPAAWPSPGILQQRVAIARAVAGEPALLLADEPTGALDSASGDGVMALLHELHAAGTTVVIITHDREIAAALPRRVRMRDGLVVDDSSGEAAGDDSTGDGPRLAEAAR